VSTYHKTGQRKEKEKGRRKKEKVSTVQPFNLSTCQTSQADNNSGAAKKGGASCM
jgi:hypothetical protein